MSSKIDAQKWLAEGGDFESLLEEVARGNENSAETELLRRCALLRSFDSTLLNGLVSAGVTGTHPVSIEAFLRRPEIVASAASKGQYCLTESARQPHLQAWNSTAQRAELISFCNLIIGFRHPPAHPVDPVETLGLRAIARPDEARAEFLDRYKKADRKSAFAECESLLNVLRWYGTLLPIEVAEALRDRERYFTGRVMFADDWSRTERFLARDAITGRFENFLIHPKKWIFHIHAKGGSGKTAYLRWLTARYCVIERGRPARTIPVAKLDMDYVRLSGLDAAPWLILLPLARQLDGQLPGRSFASIMASWQEFAPLIDRFHTSTTPTHGLSVVDQEPIIQDFAAALTGVQVVVILDTLEELVLRHGDTLAAVLAILAKVRKLAPEFRLILSGRYDLRRREELAASMRDFNRFIVPVSLAQFSKTESHRYLAEIRGLHGDYDLSAIVRKSGRNPFKLALYADLALARGSMRAVDLQMMGDVEYAYLIERIIERIPDSEMPVRWLLRYAVIPRGGTLDFEFADKVLRPHLEAEMRRQGFILDNAESGVWKTVQGEFTLDQIWQDLLRYRSESSWITIVDSRPVLQPEIVLPMRWLLQKESIFCRLHQDAVEYWAAKGNTANAIHHSFWALGPSAVSQWRSALAAAPTLTAAVEIASVPCDGELLDEEGQPLRHRSFGTVIGEGVVAEAFFERASLRVRLNLLQSNGELLRRAESDWKAGLRVEARFGQSAVDPSRRVLIEAALLQGKNQTAEALEIVNRALGMPQNATDRITLNILKSRLVADPAVALQCLTDAAALTGQHPHPAFPLGWIRNRQGQIYFESDRLDLAEECYRESLAFLKSTHAPAEDIVGDLERLLQISRSCFRYSQTDQWIMQAESLGHSSPTPQNFVSFHRARLLLDRGDLHNAVIHSDYSTPETVPGGIARHRELVGDLCIAQHRYKEGLTWFDDASELYKKDRNEPAMLALALHQGRVLIEECGDLARAPEARFRSNRWTPAMEAIRSELHVLRLTKSGRQADAKKIWELVKPIGPRITGRFLSLGIALDFTGGADVSRWLDALGQVQPWQARLPLLAPFAHSTAAHPALSPDLTERFFSVLPPTNAEDPDFVFQALALAPVLHHYSASEAAAYLLREALKKIPRECIAVRRKLILAAQRIHLFLPDATLQEYLSDSASSGPTENLVARIEMAEWWWQRGQYELAQQTLGDRKADDPYWKQLEGSQYDVRYYRLLAALGARRGDKNSGIPFARARSLAERLGWAPLAPYAGAPEPPPDLQLSVVPPSQKLILSTTPLEKPENFVVTWGGPGRQPVIAKSKGMPFEEVLSSPSRTSTVAQWADPGKAILQLQRFLPEPFCVPAPLSKPPDLAICTPEGPMAGWPWERAIERGNFRFIYRMTNANGNDRDTLAWLQHWLVLNGLKLPIDGIAGPQTAEFLKQANEKFGVLADGWNGVLTKRRVRQQMQEVSPGFTVAVLSRSKFSSSARDDVSLDGLYRDHGFDVQVLDEAEMPFFPFFQRTGKGVISLLHLPTDFIDAREGVTLRLQGEEMKSNASSSSPALTAERLAAMLASSPRPPLNPFVILDPPHPGHAREWSRQLLLRNQFAHELLATNSVSGVLAIGLVEPARAAREQWVKLISAIGEYACVGELAALCGPFAALFCWDPTLPAW